MSAVREVLERTKAKDMTEISHKKERQSEISSDLFGSVGLFLVPGRASISGAGQGCFL